jgi:hypothetical protein
MFDSGAQEAFISVTADSMDGIPSSALTIVSFSNSNRRLSSLRSEQMRAQSSSLVIEYTTQTTLQSFNGQYSSVDAMISDLNTQVATSFADPATASVWVEQSVAAGSATITTSTSVVFGAPVVDPSKTVVEEVSTWPPTLSPTERFSPKNDGSDGFDTDSTILVVVPVVGGLVVIALIICGVIWFRKRATSASKGSASTDTVSKKTTFGKAAPPSKDFDPGAVVIENPLKNASRSSARSAPVREDDKL